MNMSKMLRQMIREMIGEEPVRMKFDMQLPPEVMQMFKIFNDAGHKLYVVGGAVRDAIMGKVPKDIDLATDVNPDGIIDLLRDVPGFSLLELGKAFGVIVVRTPGGEEYEVATFRQDIGAGRRPDSVAFTTIDQDVVRRDLTINALFYDIETREIVDYVGGIDDIKTGTVRAVGDPVQRFDEDRLRVLRAVRFAARFGSGLDSATENAIIENPSLAGVSPERIRDEFLKGILSAKSVAAYFSMIGNLGLWPQIFPTLDIDERFKNGKDIPIQLASIFIRNDSSKVASVMSNMRYKLDEIAQVKFLLQFATLESSEDAVLLKKAFKNAHLSVQQLQQFASENGTPDSNTTSKFIKFVKLPPAASSQELMKQGIKGPALGKALDAADAKLFSTL